MVRKLEFNVIQCFAWPIILTMMIMILMLILIMIMILVGIIRTSVI